MRRLRIVGQRGFNMVEVLVALVILAFGLLGIAGLQIAGVKGTQSSYYRSQATVFMNDMAERMYANLPGVRGDPDAGTDPAYAEIDSDTIDCDAVVPGQCALEIGVSAAVPCSASEMAAYDAAVVACGYAKAGGGREGGVTDTLPEGRIQVECIDNAGSALAAASCPRSSRHRITVTWLDRGDKGEDGLTLLDNKLSITMTVQP
jgi:type IV pilus modification protein PilV